MLGLKAGIESFIFRNLSDELSKAIDDISVLATKDKDLENIINKNYEKILSFKNKKIKNKNVQLFDIQKSRFAIDNIAKNISQNINKIKPLAYNKNIKIISFDYSKIYNLSNVNHRLIDFLKPYYNNISEILYTINLTNTDISNIIKNVNNEDEIIFLSYNPTIYSNQIKLFNLIQNNKILVHCGIDDTRFQADGHNTIGLYCATTPAIKMLAEILIGK